MIISIAIPTVLLILFNTLPINVNAAPALHADTHACIAGSDGHCISTGYKSGTSKFSLHLMNTLSDITYPTARELESRFGLSDIGNFFGLGASSDTKASSAPAAANDESFGSKIKSVAGKVGDFFGLGDDAGEKNAAAAAPVPAEAPARPAAPPVAVPFKAAPPPPTTPAKPGSTAVGACGSPGINSATVSLIKSFEGFVPRPAPDPIGLPTVGFGHLCKTKGCAEVPFSFPLSQSTAGSLLQSDVKPFVNCLNGVVGRGVVLNDNQLGALVSWSFNVGCGAAKQSTLVKRLNNGENPNTVAAQELPKFNRAGGKVLAGLTRRRAAEVKLFQTPSSVKAHPC